ncbi:hypothetical protein CEP54_008289 [Fusarium duplospermum]|uniref:Uncharacterized protein n=1 Tax=Fusarium duplospermum TaxID=1325734 RepID=A0A428PWV6_9HYPO|nr:hypothetical protein CEP54_008289 [Fusarium duplospermum]
MSKNRRMLIRASSSRSNTRLAFPRESPASHQRRVFRSTARHAGHALCTSAAFGDTHAAARKSPIRDATISMPFSKTASHAVAIGCTRVLHGGSAVHTPVRLWTRSLRRRSPPWLVDQGAKARTRGVVEPSPKPADRD